MIKTILKVFGVLLLLILLLFAGALIFLKTNGPDYVKETLHELVENRTNGRYALKLDSFDFSSHVPRMGVFE